MCVCICVCFLVHVLRPSLGHKAGGFFSGQRRSGGVEGGGN